MEPRGSRDANPSRAVEKVVILALRSGVVLSAAIICLGLAMLIAKGIFSNQIGSGATPLPPRDLGALAAGLGAFDPGSVVTLGLVILIATPFARVAVSILAFALERDWRYVVITSIVLGILGASLALGKSLG
jgi:uncharacterized membrane protein